MLDDHIVKLNTNTEAPAICIIPGTGGMCDEYYKLSLWLKNDFYVYGLEMMGTRDFEIPLATLEEVVTQNLLWLKAAQPTGSYRLLGHSFGVHIAFEMARRLEEQGDTVDFLCLIDEYAGLKSLVQPDIDVANGALQLIADYLLDFEIMSQPYPGWFNDLGLLLYQTPVKEMSAILRKTLVDHLPDKEEDINFVSGLINVRIYNAHMFYTPTAVLNAKTIVFSSAAMSAGGSDDIFMGWQSFARQVAAIHLPGDHYLWSDENVQAIVQAVSGCRHNDRISALQFQNFTP